MLRMAKEIDVDFVERQIRNVAAQIAAQNDMTTWQSEGRKVAYEKVLDEIRDAFAAHSNVFVATYQHEEDSDMEVIIKVRTWDGDEMIPVAGVKVQWLAWHSRPGVFSVGHRANSAELEWHDSEPFEYDAYRREWSGAYGKVLLSLCGWVSAWSDARVVPAA